MQDSPALVPVGMEGGKNVNTGANDTSGSMVAAVQSPNFIARAKAGGQLTLFYQNREPPFPFKRVDLDLGMVQRYLFFREAQMSSTSKKGHSDRRRNACMERHRWKGIHRCPIW
jgi:hypothetical protein